MAIPKYCHRLKRQPHGQPVIATIAGERDVQQLQRAWQLTGNRCSPTTDQREIFERHHNGRYNATAHVGASKSLTDPEML